MSDAAFRPIALVGLMGAGKSAVARALGERLGRPVADLDAAVEARAACSVAEVFTREGEGGFRRRERAALVEALEGGAAVLACGGGIVLDPHNRALLRERCQVVWLEVTPREAARRIGETAASRPLLTGAPVEARLEALLRERGPLYESVAELRLSAGERPATEIADAILAAAPSPRRPTP